MTKTRISFCWYKPPQNQWNKTLEITFQISLCFSIALNLCLVTGSVPLVLLLRVETQRYTIIQPEAYSSLCRETSFSITLSKPQQLFLKDASVSLYISGFSLWPLNFMHSFVLWISTQLVQTSTCKSAIRTSWKMCPELSVEAAKMVKT